MRRCALLFHEADSLLRSTNAVLQEPQNCTWLSKASALVDLAPPNESVSLRSEVTIDVYNTQRTLLARKSRLIRVRYFECHPNCPSLSAAEVNQSFLRRANQFSSAPAARVRQHELATTSAAAQTAYKHSPAATVHAARRRGAA